jgi:hypothetical protein
MLPAGRVNMAGMATTRGRNTYPDLGSMVGGMVGRSRKVRWIIRLLIIVKIAARTVKHGFVTCGANRIDFDRYEYVPDCGRVRENTEGWACL